MHRSHKQFTLCTLILFLMSSILSAARTPVESLVARVPDSTIALVSSSGCDYTMPYCEKTFLGQIFQQENVIAFKNQVKIAIQAKFNEMNAGQNEQEMIKLALNGLDLVSKCPWVVGIASKPIEGPMNEPPFYAFAIIDAAQNKQKISSLLRELESHDQGQTIKTKSIAGYSLHTTDEADAPLYWGWAGNFFVIAINDTDTVALDQLKSANTKSPIKKQLLAMPANHDAFVLSANIGGIMDIIKTAMAQDEATKELAIFNTVTEKLGVDTFEVLASRVGMNGQNIVLDETISMSASLHGIMSTFKPIPREQLAMVDHRALNATALRIDVPDLYDRIMDMIKSVVAADDYRWMQEDIEEAEEELGFSIRNDLIQGLNGAVTFYSVEPARIQEAPLPGAVIIAKLNSKDHFKKAITKLAAILQRETEGVLQISTQVKDNVEINNWTIAPLAMMQVLPCWAIVDNNWIVSSNPQLLDVAIKQVKTRQEATSIVANAKFNKALLTMPKNALSVTYEDTSRSINLMMTQAQQFWPMANMFLIQNNIYLPSILPSITSVTDKMGATGGYSWADDRGIYSHMEGPLMLPSAAALGGSAAAVAILMPAMSRARHQAKTVVSMNNVKQIVLACHMYTDDNDGVLPENFEQIMPYLGTDQVLKSPQAPSHMQGDSYILVTGFGKLATINNVAQTVWVYENPEICQETITVGFIDGHVEKVPRHRFEEYLQDTMDSINK